MVRQSAGTVEGQQALWRGSLQEVVDGLLSLEVDGALGVIFVTVFSEIECRVSHGTIY